MKKAVIILFLFVLNTSLFGQINLEAQLGGSNFLGLSLNAEVDIPLSKNKGIYLAPSVGLGILNTPYIFPTKIIHTGLHLKYRRWGIGSELSRFSGDFVDFLVYPNLHYTFNLRSNWYVKVSAGALIAYSYEDRPVEGPSYLRFEGDIIPGAGVSVGYRFQLKKKPHQTNK